jgi:DNA polymerase III alpha subunit
LINDSLEKIKNDVHLLLSEKAFLPSEIKMNNIFSIKSSCIIIGILSDFITKISKSSKTPMGILTISDDLTDLQTFVWKSNLNKFSEIKKNSIIITELEKFKDSETTFVKRLIL